MAKELICIDTDICVDFLRKRDPGFRLFIKTLEQYELCITAITAFEYRTFFKSHWIRTYPH
jgi:predicted nucleic acid-binding protein